MLEILLFRAFILSLTVLFIGSGTNDTIQSLNSFNSSLTLSFVDSLVEPLVTKGVGDETGISNDDGIGSSNNIWDTLGLINTFADVLIFSGSKLFIVYCMLDLHKFFFFFEKQLV